jgi:hypothetical protein
MTTYHFIITTSYTYNGGTAAAQATYAGPVDLVPGSTRTDAYKLIRDFVAKKIGRSDFNVVFFSLEKDDLGI